jgi:hypothetical protein
MWIRLYCTRPKRWRIAFIRRFTMIIGPMKSRPSGLLLAAVCAIVVIAGLLPYTPLGRLLQFTPLPLSLLGALASPGSHVSASRAGG